MPPFKGKIILSILALAGAVIMGYLLSLHFSSSETAFCNLGEGLSCDIVNKSEYAKVAGVPVSLLGLLYFAGILAATWWRCERATLKWIIFASIAFLGPSLYFSYIEFFVLNNVCVFCELSKLLMLALILTALWMLRPERFGAAMLGTALVVAAVLAFFTYFIQSSGGPGDTYNSFAQCLNEKRFIMYGSMTCLACAKQRAMFGNAFEFIKEVECDPRNLNPETERCIAKNIEKTPTWIVEDEAGNTIKRFKPGVMPMETLSSESGCPLPQ